MIKCPFRIGDCVVYKPSERDRGWDPFDPLEIGKTYKVIDIQEWQGEKCLVVEGDPRPNWGVYWGSFQSIHNKRREA